MSDTGKIKQRSRKPAASLVMHLVGGILFLIGGARFYSKGDTVGVIVNLLAGILAFAGAYPHYRKLTNSGQD